MLSGIAEIGLVDQGERSDRLKLVTSQDLGAAFVQLNLNSVSGMVAMAATRTAI